MLQTRNYLLIKSCSTLFLQCYCLYCCVIVKQVVFFCKWQVIQVPDDYNLCNTAKALKTLPIHFFFFFLSRNCFSFSTQQRVKWPTFHLWRLRRDRERRLRCCFFASKKPVSDMRRAASCRVKTLFGIGFDQHLLVLPDRLVSEQHSPAVPHEPSGHARAHSCLWPLPGPCRLVQQLQTPCVFRSESRVLPQQCCTFYFVRGAEELLF